MHCQLLLLLLCFFCVVLAIKRCVPEKKFLRFYKIRNCYKSTLPVISWKNSNNVTDCVKFAREKNGLAFNFSPQQESQIFRNCQILGCPETGNSTTLIFDPTFDYYTAYGDFNATVNASCVKSLGLFDLIHQKMNYTDSALFCQNYGADLADILSESRTNALAALLKSLKNWYKAAYVGLEDLEVEGSFQTPMGNFMECGRFRAWGVGHPRPNRQKDDCVILDAERVWRVVNCKIKLSFICEFYPAPPAAPVTEFKKKDCGNIKNKKLKKQCLTGNELFQLYNSSTRIDQCALLNDFE